MALILSGKEVAQKKKEQVKIQTDKLKKQGAEPRLHIIRVGERPDDLYYQSGLEKACAATGITCTVQALEEKAGQKKLEEALKAE